MSATTSSALAVSSVLELIGVPVLVLDPAESFPVYNQAARSLLGPPPGDETLAQWERQLGFWDETTGNLLDTEALPWRVAMRAEVLTEAVFFLRNPLHPEGLWLRVNASPRYEPGGKISGAVVSLVDVTPEREAQRALAASDQLNELLFTENQLPVVRTTPDARILACNPAFARLVGGNSPDEVCRLRATAFHVPGGRESLVDELKRTGQAVNTRISFRRMDGSLGFAVGKSQVIPASLGSGEVSYLTSLVDITAHRQAEIARAQSEGRFAEFMRYLPGVAFIKDAEGRYLFVSESSHSMFDLMPADIIGKTDTDLWPPDVALQLRAQDREVLTEGRGIRVSEDFPVKGVPHHWTVFKFPIPDENGEPRHIGGIRIDDSEKTRLEARLQEAERMEAIGRLAGGVAHDFNNLLTVISGYGQMLQDAITRNLPADKQRSYLDELMNAARRAANLTDQLLAFSRRRVVRTRRIDLRDQVADMERMLRRVIGEHIDLSVESTEEPCVIQADPTQMEQVILNLAVNARDAMPLGGRLTIRISRASGFPYRKGGGPSVLLEVRDTGIGMDEATQLRIFEPFFTSKPRGKGTGLGLATVYGIVKQCHGDILVHSEVNEGTEFHLFFPLKDDVTGVEPTETPDEPTKLRGTERILVVEDDPSVRLLVQAMLESSGYDVMVAEDPREAQRIFAERSASIDLLLTDVIMPHMNGRDLAKTLRVDRPGLRVLFMSGYTEDAIDPRGTRAQASALIQKPFTAAILLKRVREALTP